MRRGVLLLSLICGCSSSTNVDVAPVADAGTSEPIADGPCAAPKITFRQSSIGIAPARDHHLTLVREVQGVPYLYVIGGEYDDFDTVLDDVQRARIREDGSLEPFETLRSKIPNGRAGQALGVVGDDIVMLGGVVGVPRTDFTDEILVARFASDGTLSEWKAGPKLPEKVQHASSVVAGRDVFVFGGTQNGAQKISAKVTVNADGSLSQLVPLTPLRTPRSHHASFVANGSVYLVGGIDKSPIGNPPLLDTVVRAKLEGDGALGAWESAGKVGSPLSVSAAEVVGCSVLFLGGYDEKNGGPYSDTILRGSVLADGTFQSEPALDTKLTVPRAHVHHTPVYKNFIYSVGGRANDQRPIGTIDIGTIESAGTR